jgi:hypothetical protein
VGAQLDLPASMLGVIPEAVWDIRAQLSAHPRFHRFEAILGAGVSGGQQKHDVYLPRSFEGDDAPLVRALRVEGRLEGVVGLSYLVQNGAIALAVQPFYVLAHGRVFTGGQCGWCSTRLHVDSVDAPWGAVFTLTLLGSR